MILKMSESSQQRFSKHNHLWWGNIRGKYILLQMEFIVYVTKYDLQPWCLQLNMIYSALSHMDTWNHDLNEKLTHHPTVCTCFHPKSPLTSLTPESRGGLWGTSHPIERPFVLSWRFTGNQEEAPHSRPWWWDIQRGVLHCECEIYLLFHLYWATRLHFIVLSLFLHLSVLWLDVVGRLRITASCSLMVAMLRMSQGQEGCLPETHLTHQTVIIVCHHYFQKFSC